MSICKQSKASNFSVGFAIFAAFYSKALYCDVQKNWRKKIFTYLLLMLMLFLIPFSIRFILNANHVTTNIVNQLAHDLPIITFKNGIAKTEPETMYQLYYPGTKHIFVIIDTKDIYREFPSDEALILIGNQAWQAKARTYQVKTYPYQADLNFTFGPKELLSSFTQLKKLMLIIILLMIYTLGLMLAYVCYITYSYLLGVFTTLSAKYFRLKLSAKENLRLTIVALTPGALLLSLLYLFQRLNFSLVILLLVLQICYTAYAVYCCHVNKETNQCSA